MTNQTLVHATQMAQIPAKEHVKNILDVMYPKSQLDLIAPLFNEEADKDFSRGKDWALPAFPDGKPPRFLILAGLGHISFFKKLLENKAVQENTKQFLFIENDPAVIKHLINEPFFVSMLCSPNIKVILGADMDQFKPLLFNILKEPLYSRIMECGQFFANELVEDKEQVKFYNELKTSINETIFHIYHNYGRIDDSLEGVRATLLNKDHILECPGVHELKGLYQDRVAAIVAAGPSLDNDIKTLAENKDKFVIFAADAAVKPLLKAGITPHFTTSIERGNVYQKPFWEDLPANINTQLIFFPVVHPEVLSLYPGPKRVVYRNYSYYAYFENSWPKAIMSSGGSTTHLSFNMARYMGCSDFVFVGVDGSYEGPDKDGNYRSHCNGLGHEDWATYHPLDYFATEKKHHGIKDTESMDGSTVKTNLTYSQWAKEYGEIILMHGLSHKVHVTSPTAVKIAGAVYTPLESVCQSLEDQDIPETPVNASKVLRDWDHTHLVKSVKGWLRQLGDLEAILAEAAKLTTEEEKQHAITLTYSFIHEKMKKDSLFIGFVIQNCAVEFYKLENKWMSCYKEDRDKKLETIGEVRTLFELVLGKLLDVLEEAA